ncbi:transglutaminase domain-containing protein [Rufibacter sp. XAAS-G3-1]|uniref:transglutaminase domain-containing protein n=1 Tax=Rufibacter sp. XAAS-G3-1 TaxID=2729134 RepID=UPI0015E7D12A|nr:transglutaminase domain-containing protein [Rufibacter sp. XAAS-G3-1]
MTKLTFILGIFFTFFQANAQETGTSFVPSTVAAPVIPTAQTKTTNGIARFVNSHYPTPHEKIKAIYYWLANHIAYDVVTLANMPLYYEKQALIAQTLTTRKAVCQGYAEVFQELCAKTGIPSYLVTGFVIPKGTNTPISHAWVAAQVSGQWFLFDPTWGSGVVENGKFTPRVNDRYFMVPPARMLQTHLPFDPLWQFQAQPMSYHAFISSRNSGTSPKSISAKPKPAFAFLDTLATYAASSEKAQLTATIRRMAANQVIPPVVLEHLNHLKKNLTLIRQNETVDLYNAAVNSFNAGIDQMNQFIRYKNNRFLPAKTDLALQQMLSGITHKLQDTKKLLQQIKPIDNANLFLSLQNMKATLEQALVQAAKQEQFLEKYLKTPVNQRNALFYKQALAERQ